MINMLYNAWLKDGSLGLVDEEGDFFELEVQKSILLMLRMAPEVVA